MTETEEKSENGIITFVKLEEGLELPEEARILGPPLAGAPHRRPGTVLYLDNQGYPGWNSRYRVGSGDTGGELTWDIDDDQIVFGYPMTPYMLYQPSTEKVMVKVVNFPSNDPEIDGESMWVTVLAGSVLAGTGVLENQPDYSDIQYGDIILYGHGTDTCKAEFIAVVTDADPTHE